jgi:hypothetical protein
MGNSPYVPTSTYEKLDHFILNTHNHDFDVSLIKTTYKLPEILVHIDMHIKLVHPQNYRMDKLYISKNNIKLFNNINEINITSTNAFLCLKSLIDDTIKTDFIVDIKNNDGIISFVFGYDKFKSETININTKDYVEEKKIYNNEKIKILHPYTNQYVYMSREELENNTDMLKDSRSRNEYDNTSYPTYDQVFMNA